MTNGVEKGNPKYAIMRQKRVTNFSELKRISNHNDRTVRSENIYSDLPPPECLFSYGTGTLVDKANQKLRDLGIEKSSIAGKVVAVEIILTASAGFFENATPEQFEIWKACSIAWARERCGDAMLDIQLPRDEEVPHLHCVSLAAVQKIRKKRGPRPRDPKARADLLASYESAPKQWTLSFKSMFGGERDRLSEDQDSYHSAVSHLGLARGERKRDDKEVDLGDGIMAAVTYSSTGKVKNRPPALYRQEIKALKAQADAAEQQTTKLLSETQILRLQIADSDLEAKRYRQFALDKYASNLDRGLNLLEKETALKADYLKAEALLRERNAAVAQREAEQARAQARLDQLQIELMVKQASNEEIARMASVRQDSLNRIERQTKEARREQETESAALKERIRVARELEAAVKVDRAQLNEQRRIISIQNASIARERETIAAGQVGLRAERAQVAKDVEHHKALFDLLGRAADPSAPLSLRVGLNNAGSEEVILQESAMTTAELDYHRRGWPPPILRLAVTLAKALAKMRELGERLARREIDVKQREKDLVIREAVAVEQQAREEAERQRLAAVIARMENREDVLQARSLSLVAAQEEAKAKQSKLDAQLLAIETLVIESNTTLAKAMRNMSDQEEWGSIIDGLSRGLFVRRHGADDKLALVDGEDPNRPLPAWVRSRLDGDCPRWAQHFFHRYDQLHKAVIETDNINAQLADQSSRLSAIIIDAGIILTPAQERFAAKAQLEVENVPRMHTSLALTAANAHAQANFASRSE